MLFDIFLFNSSQSMNLETENNSTVPNWLGVLKGQIESLRYGTVQVVVHEARVVQIERTEKLRFENPERGSAGNPPRNTQ
jgi:hypothetical protein